MIKRILSACLTALLICTAFQFAGTAATLPTQGSCGEAVNFTWDPETKTLTIAGSGAMQNYSEQAAAPWRLIAGEVKSLVIESGVTTIGSYAFCFLTNVREIVLPESIVSIGEGAFGWCSSLENIRLSKQLESVGTRAFVWCGNLQKIILPASVSSIGRNAFMRCESLQAFSLAGDNKNFSVEDGVLYSRDRSALIAYPPGKESGAFAIPEGVQSISAGAFTACANLTALTLSASVRSIGDTAFFDCKNLASVVFAEGLSSIGKMSFYGCTSLTDAVLPESLISIQDEAFKNSVQLERVIIGRNTTELGKIIFDGCPNAEIQGAFGSAIQSYAKQNGLSFLTFTDVILNGKTLAFDQRPVVTQQGRTLVPMRTIFENLGATISWDESTQTATAVKDGITLRIQIGSSILYKNGDPITLDVSARLIGGRTLVPLRAVSEAFDITVEWDGANYTAVLTQNK